MRVSRILEKIATSKTGQKVYSWCADGPQREKFLNTNLPQVETVLSTACYCWSTNKQKIEKDQKQLLQIQNVGSGLVGLGVAGAANKWVYNKGEEIIKDLDSTKLDPKALRKVSTGIRVALPLVTTAIVMRWVIPTLIAGFSGKVMDKKREHDKQKLDIKA